MINVETEVIKNFYYMLSYAYKSLEKEGFNNLVNEEFDNIYDLFAAILNLAVPHLLKQGLYKKYKNLDDDLSTLKGKIDVQKSISLIVQNKRKLNCEFDELTVDNELNQIIKATVKILIFAKEVKSSNKKGLKRSLLFFNEISELDLSSINWGRIQYNRNNQTYKLIINLCYMVIQKYIALNESGTQLMNNFVDEQTMDKLYEKFLIKYIMKHYPQYKVRSKEIKWLIEGEENAGIDFLPKMQSDILISHKSKHLVIDAKYYGDVLQTHHRTDQEKVRSNHLYQIYSYVKNLDVYKNGEVSGALFYALIKDQQVPKLDYIIEGNKISVRTIDLNKPFYHITKQINSFIDDWR